MTYTWIAAAEFQKFPGMRTIDGQRLRARLQPENFRVLTPLFYGHINPCALFEVELEGR